MADCFVKYSYNINDFALNPTKNETFSVLQAMRDMASLDSLAQALPTTVSEAEGRLDEKLESLRLQFESLRSLVEARLEPSTATQPAERRLGPRCAVSCAGI